MLCLCGTLLLLDRLLEREMASVLWLREFRVQGPSQPKETKPALRIMPGLGNTAV
jgi:hypothetical protein